MKATMRMIKIEVSCLGWCLTWCRVEAFSFKDRSGLADIFPRKRTIKANIRRLGGGNKRRIMRMTSSNLCSSALLDPANLNIIINPANRVIKMSKSWGYCSNRIDMNWTIMLFHDPSIMQLFYNWIPNFYYLFKTSWYVTQHRAIEDSPPSNVVEARWSIWTKSSIFQSQYHQVSLFCVANCHSTTNAAS